MSENNNDLILSEIHNIKKDLENHLQKIDSIIFDVEGKYLDVTQTSGNIIKGWEYIFAPNSKLAARLVSNTNNKKFKYFSYERIFSQSSFSSDSQKNERLNQRDILKSSYEPIKEEGNPSKKSSLLKRKIKKFNFLSLKKKKTSSESISEGF